MSDRNIPDRRERRRLLTVYGRNAVREALADSSLDCRCLHLAESNRDGSRLRELLEKAESLGLPMRRHSREALARISRNGRQDQGVALDVLLGATRELDEYLEAPMSGRQILMALDGVTNPQNLGMIIRSVTAAGIDGLLYADRGNPALGPLVIKASAGTIFRAPLLRCIGIGDAARQLLDRGFSLYRLQAGGERSLLEGTPFAERAVFVLGGETEGIGAEIQTLPGEDLHIPMARGVESLNVAVSAGLVAYAAGSRRGFLANTAKRE